MSAVLATALVLLGFSVMAAILLMRTRLRAEAFPGERSAELACRAGEAAREAKDEAAAAHWDAEERKLTKILKDANAQVLAHLQEWGGYTRTGSHARTAIGVATVPPNLPVVISAEVEIAPPKP